MAWNTVSHARDCLDLEHGLRLCTKSDGRLERVLDSMAAQKLEKIRRVLINNDVGLGDMNSEAVRQVFLFFLDERIRQISKPSIGAKHTLINSVFSRSDRFFSEASARGTSITSAICWPSASRKRALKDPSGPLAAVTSC